MLKAIGMYIFGGSNSIAVMQSGYKIDRVLEISEEIKETNSYHFVRNYPDIPIILPSEWQSEGYLDSLRDNDYDLFYANNPCSGLSAVNRLASLHNPTNHYFYDVIHAISRIKPKHFLMENAPRLTTIGIPILHELYDALRHDYNILILNDYAGNHSVPMLRPRTVITGYRKDIYEDLGTPLFEPNKQKQLTVFDTIGDLYNEPIDGSTKLNHVENLDEYYKVFKPMFKDMTQGQTLVKCVMKDIDKYKDIYPKSFAHQIYRSHDRVLKGEGIWDKSPTRLNEQKHFPSLTSLCVFIHPTQDRFLTIREYARIMGYPDDFEFYEGGKLSYVQCMAQGVPVNFIKYILSQINNVKQGKVKFVKTNLVYQNNNYETYCDSVSFNVSKLVGDKLLSSANRVQRKSFV